MAGWTDRGIEHAAPQAHVTWLPIETAPKAGARVLLYRRSWAEDMCIGFWNSDFSLWQTVGGTGAEFRDATHWAPCPQRP